MYLTNLIVVKERILLTSVESTGTKSYTVRDNHYKEEEGVHENEEKEEKNKRIGIRIGVKSGE